MIFVGSKDAKEQGRHNQRAPINFHNRADQGSDLPLQTAVDGRVVRDLMVVGGFFQGFDLLTPFDFAGPAGNSIIGCRGYADGGGDASLNVTTSDDVDYYQTGTQIKCWKPPFPLSYANNAAAVTGGVVAGGVYTNSSTLALTLRT